MSTTGRKRSSSVHQFFVVNETKTTYLSTDADCTFTSLVKHGPTNLKLHIKKKHPVWHGQVEAIEAEEKRTRTEAATVQTLDIFVSISGAQTCSGAQTSQSQLPKNDYRQRHLNELLATYVAVCPRASAHKISDKKYGFDNVIKYVSCGKFSVPCKQTICNLCLRST